MTEGEDHHVFPGFPGRWGEPPQKLGFLDFPLFNKKRSPLKTHRCWKIYTKGFFCCHMDTDNDSTPKRYQFPFKKLNFESIYSSKNRQVNIPSDFPKTTPKHPEAPGHWRWNDVPNLEGVSRDRECPPSSQWDPCCMGKCLPTNLPSKKYI